MLTQAKKSRAKILLVYIITTILLVIEGEIKDLKQMQKGILCILEMVVSPAPSAKACAFFPICYNYFKVTDLS